jgi:hypothetical protein
MNELKKWLHVALRTTTGRLALGLIAATGYLVLQGELSSAEAAKYIAGELALLTVRRTGLRIQETQTAHNEELVRIRTLVSGVELTAEDSPADGSSHTPTAQRRARREK